MKGNRMKKCYTMMIILAAAFIAGCGFDRSKPDGSGTIECTEVRAAPEVAGRIVKLAVQEGDAVVKTQLLAQLDSTNYELRRDEARAAALLADQELKRVQELVAKNSGTQKQLDNAAATADQAHARLAQAEKAVADCVIKAPMDGTITVKSTEEGEVVTPGTTLLTLSRLDEVWLSIYVPETRLAALKLGQPATVKIDSSKDAFTGTVTFISQVAEFSPKNVQTAEERSKLVYRVKITLKNQKGIFKPGMPADAWLTEGGK
jgi:HlyD family secretion protein